MDKYVFHSTKTYVKHCVTAWTAELKLTLSHAGTKLVCLQLFRGQFQVTPPLTSAEKLRASVSKTMKTVTRRSALEILSWKEPPLTSQFDNS